MAQGTVDRARKAAADGRWSEVYDLLQRVDRSGLGPAGLELLADAAWWTCRVDEEIELRQQAVAGFVAAGERRRAAYAAWLLSVRFGLRGDPISSSGWLKRAQRQLVAEPECTAHGYVACSEAERALGRGKVDEAKAHAARAVALGQRFNVDELVALAVAWQGLCHLVAGDIDEGTLLLDEALSSVTAGELDPHFTGWVYCFAIGVCMGVADLRRAGAWAEAAWAWAASLPETTPYLGLCRVRQVEVMSLRGELGPAEVEAVRACEEMLAFEPHLAGEAFYVSGEILRRKGDLSGAEEAFGRARELGHDPQPGLARVRLAQGETMAAEAALRAALASVGQLPFPRAGLLAALVEAAVARGEVAAAGAAVGELDRIAADAASDAVTALAETSRGRFDLAAGRPEAALALLRAAAARWRSLGLAFEVAESRVLIGLALRDLEDVEGARGELAAARRSFGRLGAAAEEQRAASLLAGTGGHPAGASGDELPAGLTVRECQVLRLVAAGHTNREIAASLVISEHTVARHLGNIYTKLGVSSRTAAGAYAFEHALM